MASLNYQRNTQAVKVILSELYASWATSDNGIREIDRAVENILNSAQKNLKANGSTVEKLQEQNRNNRSAAHVDPVSIHIMAPISSNARPSSPPPSPPTGRRRRSEDPPRTPSPVQTTRFFGVDEMDYLHRSGSPVGASPVSPSTALHSKPVVDPQAPVRHTGISGTGSPPSSYSHGGSSIDTTLNAVMVNGDVFSTIETNVNASIIQSQRIVHSSGSFASMPPANVILATYKDIPAFYDKKDSKGRRAIISEIEEESLKNFFAFKGSAVNRKAFPGSSLPIDTTKAVRKGQFGKLCQDVFNVPTWMKDLLFRRITAVSGVFESAALTYDQISSYFYNVLGPLTVNRRLFELIRGDSSAEFLTLENFKNIVRYLVDSHSSLEFLKQPEFQEYYCRTVAIRIIYSLERQQNGRVSWSDFDRSDLPEIMQEVDEKDVNLVLQYFSYEHFYVLYCKFWELDTDRDQLVGYDDLCKYGQGSIAPMAIKRVVEGAGRALSSGEKEKLNFEDFVYFCLSEEDKNSTPAVYYWFKVLDLDGDGILSGFELYEFYVENRQRFLEYAENPEQELSYEDMMCQTLDMLGCEPVKDHMYGLTMSDLRNCPTPSIFFNMIFNAPKFMVFEYRDPFAEHQQKLRPEKNDWDRFARGEYYRMSSEAV